MALAMQKLEGKKTLEDLMALPEDQKAELINGEIYLMSPSVQPHNVTAFEIGTIIRSHRVAKFGPRDPEGFWIHTEAWVYYDAENTFSHDLAAFWKKEHPGLFWKGPIRIKPFWACEVLSPTNKKNDILRKRVILEHHRVPFYWIADPYGQTIEVFHLKDFDNQYSVATYVCLPEDNIVNLPPFDDIEFDLSRIFPEAPA